METLRKSLLFVSVPLVLLIVVGTIRARVDESRDRVLRDLKVFSETLYLVDNYYVEDVALGQLERGAFQGLAESLGPWSSYWDPVAMSKLLARDASADVGLLLVKTPQQYVAVASVIPDSPAAEAKVRLGQYLETIDGLATKDLTLLEAQHMLQGPPGSSVKIGYFRDSAEVDEGEQLELVRRDLRGLSVIVQSPAEGVALLRVTDLAEGASRAVAAELSKLKAAGVKDLVLDLRANVGGSLSEALALTNLFVDARPVFGEKGRDGVKLLKTSAAPSWRGELVVLVSRGTVGEAELVAHAISDAKLGTLVGQPTFGKRSRQETVRLRDGSGLRLTVSEYVGPDGEPLSEKGVEPDEAVAGGSSFHVAEELAAGEDDEEAPPLIEKKPELEELGDPQLERALEILSGRAERKAA